MMININFSYEEYKYIKVQLVSGIMRTYICKF